MKIKLCICPSHLSAGACGIEYNFDYQNNDVPGKAGTRTFNTLTGCKSYCQFDKYFTWDSRDNKCYCKTSDSGRRQIPGLFSGKTSCRKFDSDFKNNQNLFMYALTVYNRRCYNEYLVSQSEGS